MRGGEHSARALTAIGGVPPDPLDAIGGVPPDPLTAIGGVPPDPLDAIGGVPRVPSGVPNPPTVNGTFRLDH